MISMTCFVTGMGRQVPEGKVRGTEKRKRDWCPFKPIQHITRRFRTPRSDENWKQL